jgi:hypothetical protein
MIDSPVFHFVVYIKIIFMNYKQMTTKIFFLGWLSFFLVSTNLKGADLPENDAKKQLKVLIVYEPAIKSLGLALEEVLKLRLARYHVILETKQSETELDNVDSNTAILPDASSENENYCFWEVHLRKLSAKKVLLAMDYEGTGRGYDEVQKVVFENNIEDTAWTLGLIIEETVSPYLTDPGNMAALGAGLAIIEPDVVGGTKKKDIIPQKQYPSLKDISLALNLSGIWSIDQILVGPKFILEGAFSKRTLASFSAGWSGTADFGKKNISGTMSQIPMELLFGFVFWDSFLLDVVGWAGFSLGFSVYHTHDGNSNRLDMTFQPAGDLYLQLVVKVYHPWALFIQGGANFPFVKDVLVNNGDKIYTHVWIMPVINLGIQLRF